MVVHSCHRLPGTAGPGSPGLPGRVSFQAFMQWASKWPHWGATVFETLKAGKLYEVSMIYHGKKYINLSSVPYIYILYVLYMHIIWVCVWIRQKSVVMDTRELEFIQPQHRVTLKRSFTDRSWWTLVYFRVCPVFGQHTKSYSWLHTVYMFIYWIQCKYEKHREREHM